MFGVSDGEISEKRAKTLTAESKGLCYKEIVRELGKALSWLVILLALLGINQRNKVKEQQELL